MRGGRIVVALAVVCGALGAAEAPRSVSVEDPCGDILSLYAGDEQLIGQPDDWSRQDLAGFELTEVTAEDGRVLGVDLVLTACTETRYPEAELEHAGVRWMLGDGCWLDVRLGHDGNRVHLSDDTSLVLAPDAATVSRICPAVDGWLVATTQVSSEVGLGADRVRVDGRRLTVALRATELGDLAGHVSAGAVIDDARADWHVVNGIGGRWTAPFLDGDLGTRDETDPAPALTLGG